MAINSETVVGIEYEVKDASSGELIDSNKGGDPLEFLMGSGQIVAGLEEAIALMSAGEQQTLTVPSGKAYGEYNDEAVETVDIEQFAGIDLAVGMALYGETESGESVQVTVKEVGEKTVQIDYNHPLAGKDLSFDVKVVHTRAATEDEIASGSVAHEHVCCGRHDHDHDHDHGHHHKHGGCGCC